MPVPIHARVRVGGALYGDARWSVGCAFSALDGSDPFAALIVTDEQGFLQNWADRIRAGRNGNVLPDDLRRLLSTEGNIDTIRVSRVGTNGRETAVAEITLAQPVAGLGSGLMPAQTACVASLQTGRPGASYRGRLYWPALAPGTSGGRLDSPAPGVIAANTAAILRAWADFGSQPVSKVIGPSVVSTVAGVATPVTSVRCGNRLDSQRRRAESQQELYSSAVLP